MIEYSATSSAYMKILLCNTVFPASSMYTKTRVDPVLSLGVYTQETTGKESDCAPHSTTDCVLFDIYYISTLKEMGLLEVGVT